MSNVSLHCDSHHSNTRTSRCDLRAVRTHGRPCGTGGPAHGRICMWPARDGRRAPESPGRTTRPRAPGGRLARGPTRRPTGRPRPARVPWSARGAGTGPAAAMGRDTPTRKSTVTDSYTRDRIVHHTACVKLYVPTELQYDTDRSQCSSNTLIRPEQKLHPSTHHVGGHGAI
jgi:hypothetical protein